MHAAGGMLYVWTVDDAEAIARFEQMGADAVITNDPRLFSSLITQVACRAPRRVSPLDPADRRAW